jgi:tripartite-type tricarboxylate transporter receptor subunit TctC
VRANPGRFNFASPGIGTINHIAMEALRMRARLDMAHVPYANSPMIQPLLANDVQTAYDALPASAPHIESGALLPLMVTGTGRATMLPNIPTMTEKGYPGMETMVAWMGLLAARGTPESAIAALNDAVRQTLSDPEMKAKMQRLGADAVYGPPAEMTTFMTTASNFHKEVVEAAKITAD